jgi:NAD(P)-dependent dehydrogenase (short-subunit alcohol dehydrogenase family)
MSAAAKNTVLITGSSSGIGAATAAAFAATGWNVVATMRRPGPVSPDGMLVTRLDVEEPASIDAAVRAGIDAFGGIDVVVNNAGYGQYGLFETVSPADARRQFEVNVFGPMAVMRAVLPHMRERGRGVIVNVSSGAGLYGLPGTSLYCASKFAIEGFSESVSYELGAAGIAVKLVIPHGGVSGTSFPGPDRPATAPPPGYEAFFAQSAASATNAPAPVMVPAGQVALTVLAAATDGTDQLRYLVGNDTRGFIQAWETLPNAEFVAFMRAHFLGTP